MFFCASSGFQPSVFTSAPVGDLDRPGGDERRDDLFHALAEEDRVGLAELALDDRVVAGRLGLGHGAGDHASDFDVVVGDEQGLVGLELAVIGDDRDTGVDGLLDRRQDRHRILGVDDDDVDARGDQRLDVRCLGLRGELGVVADVLGTAGRQGRLDAGLIPEAVALFLERRPGDADLAVAGRRASGGARAAALGAALGAAALGAVDAPPPLQAATAMATIDKIAAVLRMDTSALLLFTGSRSTLIHAGTNRRSRAQTSPTSLPGILATRVGAPWSDRLDRCLLRSCHVGYRRVN